MYNVWLLSYVRLFCDPRAPQSMGFLRQEYGSGLPFPPLAEDLPNSGMEAESPALVGLFFFLTTESSGKSNKVIIYSYF